jgi:hypothetical protein
MDVKKLNFWNYAADMLNELGGKDDLEAMARIIDKAAAIYGTYEFMIPALSEVFLGISESNPLTLLNATGADPCAALGREPKDCSFNSEDGSFWDEGFSEDYRDGHNQIYHFWAYLATTASTEMSIGGYALGYYTTQGGNFLHEILAVGDPSGATWQDYALAQAGINTGVMISFGMISPNELGDYVRNVLGTNSAPYVGPLIQYVPLWGN